jgi:nucleoside-diphosphate-sugar epimerase
MKAVVTGGAGFIGSHLVDALVARGDEVLVLDNLDTGARDNVHPDAQLIVGSVTDTALLATTLRQADVVFHLAAHKAVLRSVEHPLSTDEVNTHGTLALLTAARDAGVKRFVHSSSSSVYGGAAPMPTREDAPTVPRSPYAVSKLAAEHYCRVFSELFGLETVALRYFNVYGPRQPPGATYAAVIPLFIAALLDGRTPTVHGDGLQSRDFTFVSDAVAANLAAAAAPAARCAGRAFNVAGGSPCTLLEVLEVLGGVLAVHPRPEFVAPRPGDVRHSCADPGNAAADLGFRCEIALEPGLRATVDWFRARA